MANAFVLILLSLALGNFSHSQPCDFIYGDPLSEAARSYLGIAEGMEKIAKLRSLDDGLRIPIPSGADSKLIVAIVEFNSRLQAIRKFDPQKLPYFNDRIHEAATLHLADQYEQMLIAKREIEQLSGPKANAALIEQPLQSGKNSDFESLINALGDRTAQSDPQQVVQKLWDSTKGTFLSSLLARNNATTEALDLLVGKRGLRFLTRNNEIQTWYSPRLPEHNELDPDPLHRIRILLNGRAPTSPHGWQTTYLQADLANRLQPIE